jgi:hypothetical protein
MSSGVVNSPTLTTAALWVPLKPFLGTHTISFRMVPQQVQRQLASLYQCVQPMWFQCPCLSLTGLRLWKQGCLVFPSPPLDVILSEINKSNSTFFSIGKWTQGLTLTRQVSTTWAIAQSFCWWQNSVFRRPWSLCFHVEQSKQNSRV